MRSLHRLEVNSRLARLSADESGLSLISTSSES
jgi:hypothetical protein